MNNEEARRAIADGTGIPENLLSGDTVKNIIKQARDLLAYRGTDPTPAESTRESFAQFINASLGIDGPQSSLNPFAFLDDFERKEFPSYPDTKDPGTVPTNSAPQNKTRDQFAGWFDDQLSNPTGWH